MASPHQLTPELKDELHHLASQLQQQPPEAKDAPPGFFTEYAPELAGAALGALGGGAVGNEVGKRNSAADPANAQSIGPVLTGAGIGAISGLALVMATKRMVRGA